MSRFLIKRGLSIPLEGKPSSECVAALEFPVCKISPSEYPGLKHKLLVDEGDAVRAGDPLVACKRREGLRIVSPVAGTVRAIVYGERRAVDAIEIEPSSAGDGAAFPSYGADEIRDLPREKVLEQLLTSGLFCSIIQRPFSHVPEVDAVPKSIFVNAMETGPYHADPAVVLRDQGAALQAAVDALGRLTEGAVHVCSGDPSQLLPILDLERAEKHVFDGPHPAGNASVHIHHVDPIRPGDTVWTIKARDAIAIGRLFLDGSLPTTRIVALGGPGIRPEARKHYRIRRGATLEPILRDALADGAYRLIQGDVLTGFEAEASSPLRDSADSLTAVYEVAERRFLGWLDPGFRTFSHSRTFLSNWLPGRRAYALNTDVNGSLRAMVKTGHYDRFLPLDLMADFLIRAVLAHDTDEAVQLGILETDPEDFALCSYVCPSKMDLMGVIRAGLDEVEAEGL